MLQIPIFSEGSTIEFCDRKEIGPFNFQGSFSEVHCGNPMMGQAPPGYIEDELALWLQEQPGRMRKRSVERGTAGADAQAQWHTGLMFSQS